MSLFNALRANISTVSIRVGINPRTLPQCCAIVPLMSLKKILALLLLSIFRAFRNFHLLLLFLRVLFKLVDVFFPLMIWNDENFDFLLKSV